MADYSDQLNQNRAKSRRPVKKIKSKSINPDEITNAEWMTVGFIAALADLLGPFGFPCILILCFWSVFKFHKFPTNKIIVAGSAEVLSFGFLPGWTGYVVYLFLEQKGYLPKWISKWTGKLIKSRT
jgi:hypothetical protein